MIFPTSQPSSRISPTRMPPPPSSPSPPLRPPRGFAIVPFRPNASWSRVVDVSIQRSWLHSLPVSPVPLQRSRRRGSTATCSRPRPSVISRCGFCAACRRARRAPPAFPLRSPADRSPERLHLSEDTFGREWRPARAGGADSPSGPTGTRLSQPEGDPPDDRRAYPHDADLFARRRGDERSRTHDGPAAVGKPDTYHSPRRVVPRLQRGRDHGGQFRLADLRPGRA